MNKQSFEMIVSFARNTLKTSPTVTFNDLRRANSNIKFSADDFYRTLQQNSQLNPEDLKFTLKQGVIDPNVITDLEIEMITKISRS